MAPLSKPPIGRGALGPRADMLPVEAEVAPALKVNIPKRTDLRARPVYVVNPRPKNISLQPSREHWIDLSNIQTECMEVGNEQRSVPTHPLPAIDILIYPIE